MSQHIHITEALEILKELGFPREQQNERSALCLLALLNLTPEKDWAEAEALLLGVTPIMNWVRVHYSRNYAPNTRETFRRQTIHQFLAAGLLLQNPDEPLRPVNSPATVYQIDDTALTLLKSRHSAEWANQLMSYVSLRPTLIERYALERQKPRIPVQVDAADTITLSPGKHSALIKAVIEEFAPRFAPDAKLIYVGDTGKKWSYFDQSLLDALSIQVDAHGKMPDVVLYDAANNWLFLVEAVTSHGPMDGKRHDELSTLFAGTSAGLVYVTAFPTRSLMARYLHLIAWKTEVWVAESPSHLIHFDGDRFLGPFPPSQ
jgi:hypothetical protein